MQRSTLMTDPQMTDHNYTFIWWWWGVAHSFTIVSMTTKMTPVTTERRAGNEKFVCVINCKETSK